jgi:N-acetylglucosamine-6-phosphate deacetylase
MTRAKPRQAPSDALVFHNGAVALADRTIADGMVIVRGGRIEHAGRARRRLPPDARIVDARGGLIAPGFVDIHVHGGDGADFMDGTDDAVRTAIACHARHGTTTIFPHDHHGLAGASRRDARRHRARA